MLFFYEKVGTKKKDHSRFEKISTFLGLDFHSYPFFETVPENRSSEKKTVSPDCLIRSVAQRRLNHMSIRVPNINFYLEVQPQLYFSLRL